MADVIKTLALTATIFLVLALVQNLNPRLFRLPIEPRLDRFGFMLYLPVFSSIIISVIISILLRNSSF